MIAFKYEFDLYWKAIRSAVQLKKSLNLCVLNLLGHLWV